MYLQMQVDTCIKKIGMKDCNLVVKLYCYIFNLFLCSPYVLRYWYDSSLGCGQRIYRLGK